MVHEPGAARSPRRLRIQLRLHKARIASGQRKERSRRSRRQRLGQKNEGTEADFGKPWISHYEIGLVGFEPTASWSRTRRSDQAEPQPELSYIKSHSNGSTL